tara:strand:+ start:3643 stop:5739 length:2097 start_codon:yes stop_codon:yes gene_type:complete
MMPKRLTNFNKGKGEMSKKTKNIGALLPISSRDAKWNSGFLGELYKKSSKSTRETLKMALWNEDNSATFENFRTAAKLQEERSNNGYEEQYEFEGGTSDWKPRKGKIDAIHQGTSWSDGDCYKYIEGLSRIFSSIEAGVECQEIKLELDELINIVGSAQEVDGYLQTQITIPYRPRWVTRIFHEDYNLGHLFTAAAVHFEATGETSFINIAKKAADNLYDHFIIRQRDAGSFGWNPTHIPGLVDLYRATGEKKYLEIAIVFLERRGSERPLLPEKDDSYGPDDQNQMAVAFSDEKEAVGHAVTAGYLYLGASEIYRETGDIKLLKSAELIWEDIVNRKLYITGAIGALPVGISKRGFKVWESFGREYHLPHRTAYNETCANITWGMFCRSMFVVTGQPKYADEMERVIYNAGISGMSITGDAFNYANPLRWYSNWDTDGESFGTMRHFSHERWKIHTCYCCPPQIFRLTSQINEWAYYTSNEKLILALYGSGKLNTIVPEVGNVSLVQKTSYPWNGKVKIIVEMAPKKKFSIALRIPSWSFGASIEVNGSNNDISLPEPGTIACLSRIWRKGDLIELDLPMPVRLVSAHPKVEECRGQVAIMKGPIVFCAESTDLEDGLSLEDVSICQDFQPRENFNPNLLGGILTITGNAKASREANDSLYRETNKEISSKIDITLIPYFAWKNRGRSDMTVWLPAV